jgi:membrane protein DedA with SNARE-associated domain
VHLVEAWMATLPPLAICAMVGLVIGAENTGLPLPGEIALVGALLATRGSTSPWSIAFAAALGSVVGSTTGYLVGRRGGQPLLDRLGRRFPRHFGPSHRVRAEHAFTRHGAWAVFFGRFVALLRIMAGPLAGALGMPWRRFATANIAGGVVWAYGTTLAVYYAGQAADRWLKQFSWLALVAVLLAGLVTTLVLRRRAARAELHAESEEKVELDTAVG